MKEIVKEDHLMQHYINSFFLYIWKDFIAKDQQKQKNNTEKILRFVQEISQFTKHNRNKRRRKNSTRTKPPPTSPDKSTQQLTHTHFHTALTTTN